MEIITDLYERLVQTSQEDFYWVEGAFFLALTKVPEERRPDCVVAFLTLSSWLGNSLRSGVWTYYEVADPAHLRVAVDFLRRTGERELAEIFDFGVHDYQSGSYAPDFNYPQEWIDESEQIDDWITAHEKWLHQWEKNLLLENKAIICSLE